MANKIIVKKSSVAGKVPVAGDLDVGELAVNVTDKKLYTKDATGAVVQLGGGSGSGDVVGPSSATDNAVARFDTTSGKLIQNSVVTIDDDGNIADILSEQYDTTTTPPTIVEGLEAWDSGNGTLEVGLKGGNVSYKYGQQEFVRAYNGSGSAMTKGQVVYIVGAQGNRVDVRLAKADAESTSAGTIGFVAEAIANGAEGWVQVSGTLPKLDTSALTAGVPLYLSAATAGAYTTTRPTAPNHTVILGWVERVSATVGSFYVKIDNGYELDELHNVLITSAASGNTLIYDAVAGVWENANLTAGTGVNVTNGAGSISIGLANTSVTAGSYTLASITVDAQGRLTSASSGSTPSAFPSGTRMLFAQSAAPTGWTKDITNYNNHALRVVTGTATSGGTVDFTTAFASQAVSGSLSSTTATNQTATQGGSLSSTTATNQAATQGGSISSTTATNQAATQGGSVSTSTSVSLSGGGSVSNTTLSQTEMPNHSHLNGWLDDGGNHMMVYGTSVTGVPGSATHKYNGGTATTNTGGFQGFTSSTGSTGAHSHGFTNPSYSASSSSSYTGSSHNHLQDSHSHSFTGSSHNHTQDAHSHTFTGSSHNHTQDAHSHTFTGTSINLAVKYLDVITATKD